MSKKRKEASWIMPPQVCAFCLTSTDDEVLYGKFNITESVCAHSNCLYFASGLVQSEDERLGIDGFRFIDIEGELQRGRKLACCYCKKKGATVGCCERTCKKSFHYNCGLDNGALNQTFGMFCSYCKKHSPKQTPLIVPENCDCVICCEEILHDESSSSLYAPCCKNGWFHKMCLQNYAYNAGSYYFKCPLCNNSKKFLEEMQVYGVFIPTKDASWELEDHAFEDLLVTPECNVNDCLCVKGRKFCSKRRGAFTLLSCILCGYNARHIKCGRIAMSASSWVCDECEEVEDHIKRSREWEISKKEEESRKRIDTKAISSSSGLPSNSALNNYYNDDSEDNSICMNKKLLNSSNIDNCKPILLEKTRKLSNIKNLPLDLVTSKSSVNVKTSVFNKKAKKRKLNSSCCGQNNYCIKRYFGQECCKYRI